MPLLNPNLKLIAKFDSELRELRTPDGWADSCVSSVMAFWKGTERLVNWSSPYTKKETGVNEPTTAASLCIISQEGCMPRCRENNWTKTGWYPVRFLSWPQHYKPHFHSPANFLEILGACQRRMHIFCRPRKTTWSGSSWKALGQGLIVIFGALSYLKLGALLEGLRRLMSYKSALRVLATFTELVVPIHKHITLFWIHWYQEPEPCKPPFVPPNWGPTLSQGTQNSELNRFKQNFNFRNLNIKH